MRRSIVIIFLIPHLAPLFAPGDVTLPVCSASVHDAYKATGPDGAQYATWHPIVDTKNGCHFDHEHGSSPAAFGVPAGKAAPMHPLFGYTANHGSMPEGHAGFKVYVFEAVSTTGQRLRYQILHHFGTASATTAACTRYHTLDMRVLDLATNTLLADIHAMGDFGRSVDGVTNQPLTPAACPDQAVGWNPNRNGQRNIPVGPHAVAYEPWRAHIIDNILGFTGYSITFNTPDAQTKCDYITCTASLPFAGVGAFRFVTWGGLGFTSGANTGTFCTNAHATALLACSDPAAVQQYVAPGLNFSVPNMAPGCRPWGRFEYDYICGISGDSEVHYKANSFVTGAN